MLKKSMDLVLARKYIGEPVQVHTISKGSYVCELVEIIPYRTWRAKVRILSVLKLPNQLAFSKYPLSQKAYKQGEIVTFNGNIISPYTDHILPYHESLAHQINTS